MSYRFIDENRKHLHTFGGTPLLGTSTVTGVMSKPLTWWASGLAVGKLGWTNSKLKINGRYITVPQEKRIGGVLPYLEKIKQMLPEAFLALLDDAYRAHSEKLDESAGKGIDRHEILESYVKGCIALGGEPMDVQEEDPLVRKFIEWSLENVKEFKLSEAHCYSERLWLGGIVDCVAILKSDDVAVIDFKSSREAYDNQWIQTALYDVQLSEHGAFDKEGNKIAEPMKATKYLIVPFGAPEFTVEERTDLGGIKKAAEACVVLYKFTQDVIRTN